MRNSKDRDSPESRGYFGWKDSWIKRDLSYLGCRVVEYSISQLHPNCAHLYGNDTDSFINSITQIYIYI